MRASGNVHQVSQNISSFPIFVDTASLPHYQAEALVYVDAFERQIKELFIIENKDFVGVEKSVAFASPEFAVYEAQKRGNFTHVYFPWNAHLVKTVSAEDYARLKTNRNQDLITAIEQDILAKYRIAVLGLSVGSNIATVATQAGISREILLADFDELDTTNLNRILAGVHQIGINKATVAARRIYEADPFAVVHVLQERMTAEKILPFLEAGKLDCIVDEVDDIAFKVHVRRLAMKYHIPVVMVTDNGDGVVLHVERYDLGCSTIFGKDASYFDQYLNEPMTKEKAGRFIMEDIVGGVSRVDPAMIASVKRVLARELVSWSQLGSAALLGGVVATYIIKQIALGKDTRLDIRAHIMPTESSVGTHTS